MEIVLYTRECTNPDLEAERWMVDAPQLVAGCFAATLEEARREVIAEVLHNLAYYLERGRFTVEEVREVRFLEVPTTMTFQELADLAPQWWKDAVQQDTAKAAE